MLSMTILSIFAFLLLTIAIMFIFIFKNNFTQNDITREKYAKKVKSLRMHKMLKALNIDLGSYLLKVPIVKIHQSMSKCEACQKTDLCDHGFKDEYINTSSIDYCPNQDCLEKYKLMENNELNS